MIDWVGKVVAEDKMSERSGFHCFVRKTVGTIWKTCLHTYDFLSEKNKEIVEDESVQLSHFSQVN